MIKNLPQQPVLNCWIVADQGAGIVTIYPPHAWNILGEYFLSPEFKQFHYGRDIQMYCPLNTITITCHNCETIHVADCDPVQKG